MQMLVIYMYILLINIEIYDRFRKKVYLVIRTNDKNHNMSTKRQTYRPL